MPLTRRELLKGMGVVVGGLGLSAAGYEHLVPFIHQPENLVPGAATWYATSCRECPAGCGMLVRNRDARVVKCEGNPVQPISNGRLCPRGQAALQGLYDPDRVKHPMCRVDGGDHSAIGWDRAMSELGPTLDRSRGRIALITDLEAGSTDSLMRAWLDALGSSRIVVYEPISYDAVKAATGGFVPRFRIADADYLISFSADFLETWISPVEYAWQFAAMRQVRDGSRARFVYVGPRVSATAANADVRIIVPSGTVAAVAMAIASEMGVPNVPAGFSAGEVARRLGIKAEDILRVAREFATASAPLALPGGDDLSARAAMMLNNAGAAPIDLNRPHALTFASGQREVDALVDQMEAGEIDVLFVYRANPVYSLPNSEKFTSAISKVVNVISLSSYMDETATHANWILPSNTPLESWGDYRPYPDVTNIMQPTMGTVFDTRHVGDILIQLAGAAGVDVQAAFGGTSFYQYLRRQWGVPVPEGEGSDASALAWERAAGRGGVWTAVLPGRDAVPPDVGLDTTVPPADAVAVQPPAPPSVSIPSVSTAPPVVSPESILPDGKEHEVRLWAYPHPYLYDGRGANRSWLQEIPEPVVKTVWGSWVELHPDTARRLGVANKQVVEITHDDQRVQVPVLVWDGVAKDTAAVAIGQGHSAYGSSASGTGSNIWPLLVDQRPTVTIARVFESQALSTVRGSSDMMGRDLALVTELGEPVHKEPVSMPMAEGYGKNDFYPGHEHVFHRWAMIVDLDRCIGCNACVAACYAENNVAVVGTRDVRWGREMAWLRIDRYIDWSDETVPIRFQPMLCQHCDAAPCEAVCPVYAASHSEEGVNMQVYNRCVGTRYCSNNCPYKVRRFNWYSYNWPEPLNWQLNPDVTVRDRGVMEKCTFCIQRIRQAEITARKEGREPADGEVVTACQQTCPTGVYTFGDLMDPNSKVSQMARTDPRVYQALHEANTKPAVLYLKRIVDRGARG